MLIEVHHSCKKLSESTSTEDDSDDSDEDEEGRRDETALRLMMAHEYPDAEIDKLIEHFKNSSNFKNDILNGDFIENDIRLSE